MVSPSTPSGKDGQPVIGGFSARALDDKGELTAQTYFTLDLAPGEEYSGRVLISNQAKRRQRLHVYSVDGITGETTGTVYANKDDARQEASLWITPARDLLRIDGRADRRMHFTVKVPADATPGDHVGAIAMESAVKPKGSGQFAIKEIIRVAVAVQIRVRGDASPALKIEKLGLSALGGTQIPSVVTQLHNTGQLLCRPELRIALSKDGKSIGTVVRQLDTILPGDSIPYPLPWPQPLSAGKYQANATTTGCGAPAQLAAELELKGALVGSKAAPGTAITPDTGGGVPIWAVVLAVLAAMAGTFFLARRKPRERKDDAPATPIAGT